ncbi:DUF6443 domain-containing protein [Fulvivirga ulvae]|uniref:DUF6443 domain-containing protein n=1 Tax=Fulvivirga ulvae TaxID=2904245 RepID=UPI001F1B4E86|nr:DUF6443 domain-containing protein [Fulvivirga ulvae]UII34115.1 DUF6443 domain-containing protein [Fulvivirga ulvae]
MMNINKLQHYTFVLILLTASVLSHVVAAEAGIRSKNSISATLPNPVAVNKQQYGKGYAKFEATGSSGTYYWYNNASDATPINATPKSSVVLLISSTTVLYAQGYTPEEGYSAKVAVTVSVHKFPVVKVIGQTGIDFHQEWVELSTTEPHDQYQWYKNGSPISGATERNYKAASAGFYMVGTRKTGFGKELKSDPFRVAHMLEDENRTYSINTQVLVPGAKSAGDVIRLDATDKLQSISYYDEYGRVEQQMAIGASPSGKDIVSVHEYDALGRESKSNLPFTHDGGSGLYIDDWQARLNAFYQQAGDGIANTLKPFAEVERENSPMGRIKRSGAQGEAWQLSGTHTTSYDQQLNDGTENVRIWKIDETTGLPVSTSSYTAGQLTIQSVTDEQGVTTKSYTAPEGYTILQEAALQAKTYAVYDERGRMRFVLQPELVKSLIASGSYELTPQQIENMAFQYQYDAKGRLTGSKTPGADWIYMVYDELDRPVLSQDGNQRLNSQWMFVKYDVFDRPVSSGIYQGTASREDMQQRLDRYYNQKIEWEHFTGTALVDGHLQKNLQTSAWGDAGASSGVVLESGQDGTIHFEITDLAHQYMIGLSDADVNAHYNTIDYAIYIDRTRFYVYHNGNKVWNTGLLEMGDIFQIERKGSEIRYKQNGSVFYTLATANTGALIADAAIYTAGGRIDTEVTIRNYEQKGTTYFGYSDMAFPQIADQQSFLNVVYYDDYNFTHASAIEYTYEPNEENPSYFVNVKGLVTGAKTRILGEEVWINTVTYYDDRYRNIQSVSNNHKEGIERLSHHYDFTGKVLKTETSHTLPLPVIWKNMTNVEQAGSIFTSTASVNWGGGMASANQLKAGEDGWIETTVISFGNKFLGFSEWDNGVSFNDIDFAMYMNGTNLKAYRKGTYLATIGTLELGDKLRIERAQGTVMIYHNNNLAYTFADSSAEALVADASLQQAIATLGYIRCSFGVPAPPEPPYEVLWASRHGNTFENGTLTKQHASNSWDIGGSYSFNRLEANTDGWVTFPAAQHDVSKVLGLAHEDQGSRYNDINYAIYLKADGTVAILEKGDELETSETYQSSDIFKIERVNGEIRFLKNDQVFHISETKYNGSLMVDVSIYSQGGLFTNVQTSFPYLQPKSSAIDLVQRFDYDRVGRPLKTWHEVTEQIQWQKSNHIGETGDGIEKTAGTNYAWDTGAESVKILPAGSTAWVEMTAASADKALFFGLSATSADHHWNTIENAFYLTNGGEVQVRRIGSSTNWLSTTRTYSAGDRFRIERNGTSLLFYHNEQLIYTRAALSAVDLRVDISLYETGSRIISPTLGYGEVLLAECNYNELGELIEKNLHKDKHDQDYAQSVDYRYNIRGWLKSINNASLEKNDENNPNEPHPFTGEKDYWGMELSYEDNAGTGNTGYFNGNASAMKTSYNMGIGEIKQQAYNYTYDDQNRLTGAAYKAGATGTWTAMPGYYDVEDIRYDLNGNITNLKRYANYSQRTKIDDLDYDYNDATAGVSNRLTAITDNSIAEPAIEGFRDNPGADYTYDANGNITSDNNKDIADISYNFMNMPEQIVKTDGSKVTFTYDASGGKLAKYVYDPSGNLVKTTDYIGAFTYENDTLQYIHHQQGRILPGELDGSWEYQYYLSDHLGNVRTVFTTKEKVHTFKATMESEEAHHEGEIFTNLDKSRAPDPDAVSGDEVSRLNSVQMTGPALSLPVYPGDRIDMKVQGYHRGGSGNASPVDLDDFITALAGAFGGVSGGNAMEQAIYSITEQAIDPMFGGIGLMGTQNDQQPAAYLNYIIFTKDFKVHQHGHTQIPAAANTVHKLRIDNITSDIAGFIYIYLTNESNTLNEVYFDDFEVTLTEGKVVQSNNYYPFGLQQNTSWTRAAQTPNAHKFNAATEYNDFTDTYDTPFRQYDPATGRFNGVDALAHMMPNLTPYRFGFNNPVSFNDPTGLIELPLVCKTCETNGGSGGSGFDQYDDLVSSGNPYSLVGSMGPGSGRHWTDQLWRRAGAVGMERNARMMSQQTFDRFYNITDDNRWEKANEAAVNVYGKVGSVEVGGYKSDKYGWKGKPARNGWSVEDFILDDPKMVYAGVNPFEEGSALRENGLNTAAGVAGIVNGAASIVSYSPRPMYTGPVEWSTTVKGSAKFGARAGIIGLAFTGADMINNGVNTSNGLDAVMGGVGFGGPVGAIVSGVYFIGNLITTGVTGESIGQHIDKYYWMPMPGSVSFVPIGKKIK